MITISGLAITQGGFHLRDINLQIDTGEYGVLMGKSGCGKTTVMEAICGLRPTQSGSIQLGDRDVTKLRPGERNIGYVPQDGALFPTMTVFEQVAFGLRVRKIANSEVDRRVKEIADTLGISNLLDRKPAGLSGGESQRVAMGRALILRPAILCLDEPLSSLDEDTRGEIIDLLLKLRRESPVTTLHITHQRSEARELADKLFVLSDGKLSAAPVDGP